MRYKKAKNILWTIYEIKFCSGKVNKTEMPSLKYIKKHTHDIQMILKQLNYTSLM
ncbi:MAG: hypothetical protein IJ758_03620 [Clostridia bacterium]|nr:hypothetical protein [Clostridia bacterium]